MKRALWILAACSLLAFTASDATTTRRERIQVVYDGSPANYQLWIFGGQALRCRGNNLHVTRDERGDGDGPIVVSCQ